MEFLILDYEGHSISLSFPILSPPNKSQQFFMNFVDSEPKITHQENLGIQENLEMDSLERDCTIRTCYRVAKFNLDKIIK